MNRHQRRAAERESASGPLAFQQVRGGPSHSPDAVFRVGKAAQIDALIAHCASAGFIGRVELLRAVRAGEIAMVEPDRPATISVQELDRAGRPVVVVLGDDDYQSTGPTGWAALPALLRWARGAMIHGTGADRSSYRMAIGGVLAVRKFLLVETDSAHLREWGEALLAQRVPFWALQPRDGGQHPVMPARGSMQ